MVATTRRGQGAAGLPRARRRGQLRGMRPRIDLSPCALWLALAAAPLAACGSQAVAADEPTQPSAASGASPEGEATAPARQVVHVALELDDLMNVREPGADQTRVSLITRDESGAQQRHVLGVFAGICTAAEVGGPEGGLAAAAIAGADCRGGARQTRVRVLHQADELVALRAWLDEDDDTFPSYEELQRVAVGAGAHVVVGPPQR
jgi:hypothetical protein